MRSRFMLIVVVVALVALAGCFPPSPGQPDNPNGLINPGNVARLQPAWVAPGGSSPPIVYEGRVIASSSGDVRAYDARTGSPLWATSVPATIRTPVVAGGRLVTAFSKGSWWDDNWSGGTFTIDPATGAYVEDSTMRIAPLQGAAALGETVALTQLHLVRPWERRYLVSYAGKTGLVQRAVGSGDQIVGPPTVAGDFVYVANGSVRAFALDACPPSVIEGLCAPTWVGGAGWTTSKPIELAPGVIGVAQPDGNVAVLDGNSGALLWIADTPYPDAQPPSVDLNGMMYVAAHGGISKFAVAGCGAPTCAPIAGTVSIPEIGVSRAVVSNGVIYAGRSDGQLQAFDAACANGTCASLLLTPVGGTRVEPVATGDAVYVATNSGKVAAYRLP